MGLYFFSPNVTTIFLSQYDTFNHKQYLDPSNSKPNILPNKQATSG